jgi:hypothetical protein
MSRPVPKAGILDISPYTPGKSPVVEPGRKTYKLSANETPFGPSAKAKDAFATAVTHLEDYPEGTSRVLREAIGRRYGLDPAQIICGAGSDEILNLLAHVYLGPGDEAISTAHGFLVYPIATQGNGATNVVAPETDFTCDVDAILKCVSPRTKLVWLANPNNPTGTYLPSSDIKRLRDGLPEHVLLVLDAAYSDYVTKGDYDSGLDMAKTTENTVATFTFSKVHGLAALRIGWMFGPAHIRRCAEPRARSVQRLGAGDARSSGCDRGHRPCGDVGRLYRQVGRHPHRGDRQARHQGHAQRGELHPDAFSGNGQNRGRRRRVSDQARAGVARGHQLWPAEFHPHDHRYRGGQPPGDRDAA